MNPQKRVEILLTCEHGGNEIPAEFAELFEHSAKMLKTHAGWDIGALALAKQLEKLLPAPLYFSRTSRLVVDLNRSLHHPRLFSNLTKSLPPDVRAKILSRHYNPYRNAVTNRIADVVHREKLTLHLSIHSFTPRISNKDRSCEFGLLYDPSRTNERKVCHTLKDTLTQAFPELRTRLNYPYRGTADGLTKHLRRLYADGRYAGIEIEVNQSLLAARKSDAMKRQIAKAIAGSVQSIALNLS